MSYSSHESRRNHDVLDHISRVQGSLSRRERRRNVSESSITFSFPHVFSRSSSTIVGNWAKRGYFHAKRETTWSPVEMSHAYLSLNVSVCGHFISWLLSVNGKLFFRQLDEMIPSETSSETRKSQIFHAHQRSIMLVWSHVLFEHKNFNCITEMHSWLYLVSFFEVKFQDKCGMSVNSERRNARSMTCYDFSLWVWAFNQNWNCKLRCKHLKNEMMPWYEDHHLFYCDVSHFWKHEQSSSIPLYYKGITNFFCFSRKKSCLERHVDRIFLKIALNFSCTLVLS